MKQVDLGLDLSAKRTRKREFLEQMDRVVPWAALREVRAEDRRGHGQAPGLLSKTPVSGPTN